MRILSAFLLAVVLATNTSAQDTTLTPSQKLYGLSRFWQEANYNFAYFDNVPTLNWDSAYQVAINEVLATKSVFEYYRSLQKFCALLKDGHTNVFMPAYISSQRGRRSFGDIKLEVSNIDGKAIVVNTALNTKDVVPVGSQIVAVNNIPVKEYVDKNIRPYISQSASYILEDWCIDYLLDGFLGDTIRIGFIKPGSTTIQSLPLKREVKADVPWLQPSGATGIFELTWLPGNIARINLNSFNDRKIVDTFITALPALQKAKAIIIDLRQNGGGVSDHAAAILSYFTDSNIIRGSKWLTRQHRAAYKAWGTFAMKDQSDTSEWSNTARNYFKGTVWYEGGQMTQPNLAMKDKRMTKVPMAVLFGHSTASAAEDFLIMLDGLGNRAVTIGQRSFGSTGQPLPFTMPGGGSARICTKRDVYPDGRVFVGKGIAPMVEVNPTLNDYLQRKDVILEKAVELLKSK